MIVYTKMPPDEQLGTKTINRKELNFIIMNWPNKAVSLHAVNFRP